MNAVPQQLGTSTPGIAGLSATNTTAGTADAIFNQISVFTTVSAGALVRLPASGASAVTLTITNTGANDLGVLPDAGGQIGSLGTDAPAYVPANGGVATFRCLDPVIKQGRQWYFAIANGVTVDPGVNVLGAYNQAAAITRTTIAGAGAGPRLSTTTLNYNTLFGYYCGNLLDANSTENTIMGYAAGANQPTGNFNTYVGNGAGWGVNYSADFQTFIGVDVFRGAADHGFFNSGVFNTGVGFQVFRNGNFTRCVGVGGAAMRLFNNTAALATLSDCVAVGYNAMGGDATVNGSLSFITAVGNQAAAHLGLNGLSATFGGTFMGFAAAGNLNSGRYSTLIGYESGLGKGDFSSVGNFVTAVGAFTATSVTSGIALQLFGYNAGNALTSGLSNDFFGYTTGQLATTASYNSVFGSQSALQLTTGQKNTIIGPFCGATNLITGSNNILIGYSLDTIGDDSNTINIGNAFMATSAGGPTAAPVITLAGASVAFANALFSSTTLGPALDVPSQIVTAAAPSAPGTAFAPGDSVNGPSGGRYNVAATQVVTATVASGGTGGTPGVQTFFGTTGLGGKWQGQGTVNGSGVLTGAITILGAGNYSFNPTLAGDLVSGGGLVGATIAVTMGVKTLTIAKPDVSASPPGNPVPVTPGAKQILTNETGTGLTVTLTWGARKALQLNPSGNDVLISNASLLTTAVVGFLGLPSMAGTPTGVPTNAAAGPLLGYNSASNTLNVYSGGAWNHVTLTAGAA